jgi:hypothetical protein
MTDYIIAEKGDEVISERHQKDFKKEYDDGSRVTEADLKTGSPESFTDVNFDDI